MKKERNNNGVMQQVIAVQISATSFATTLYILRGDLGTLVLQ